MLFVELYYIFKGQLGILTFSKGQQLEKYFFISLTLTKFVSMENFGKQEEDEDDIPGLEREEYPEEQSDKKERKLPVQTTYSTCIISPSGFFIPNAIEDQIKKETKADAASLIFVREMSKEEYGTSMQYALTKDLPVPPTPVSKDVLDEIDDLVSRTESGDLRAYSPLKPDYPKNKEEAELRKLGLDDLFNTDGLWDEP